MGRQSSYNDKDAAEIVSRLSKGEPLAQICRDDWLPSDTTVRNWMDADAAFSSAIADARARGYDAIALDTLRIADGKLTPEEKAEAAQAYAETGEVHVSDVQRDRLRVDTRLKLLAKWDPKRYGDKVAVVGGGPDDQPIQTMSVSNRDRAKAMAALVAKQRG